MTFAYSHIMRAFSWVNGRQTVSVKEQSHPYYNTSERDSIRRELQENNAKISASLDKHGLVMDPRIAKLKGSISIV